MAKWQPLEQAVADIMAREQIPGVSIAIARNNEVIYAQGFGVSNIEEKTECTPDTIFGIASITKSFTALTIMRLAEKGKLTLQDSVIKHLPEFELKGYDNIKEITIHHLLSHTSGIPTLERKESIKGLDAHLVYLRESEIEPLGKPGEYFCYNNDMYLLLGAIIEKITGKSYKEVIKEEIFIPNEMTRTTYEIDDLFEFDNVSTPYTIEDNELSACPWPILGNYAVGGGIRSTALDLVKYGNMFLNEKNEMSKPVAKTNGQSAYGYGLQITPYYGNTTLMEHGGSQPGVSSNFGFIPEENLTAVVLTNVSGASASDIWLHAVNAALDMPLHQSRYIEPHYYLKEYELPKFIGKYETGEGSSIEISSVIGELQANIDGKQYMLRASNEETLVIKPIEKPIRFYFNEENEAWALFYGLRMFIKKEDI